MPLQKQTVDIPIAKGLGQKVDPRLLVPGSFTTLANAVQDKIGSLVKRPGVVDLGIGASSPWGRTLNPVSNGNLDCRLVPGPMGGVAQVNGFRMWKRSSLQANDTKAYDLDDVTNILVQRHGLETTAKAFACVDLATDGNKVLVTWIAPSPTRPAGQPYYAVLDATTLETLVPPQQLFPVVGGIAVLTINFLRTSSLSLGTPAGVAAAIWQNGNLLYGSKFDFTTLAWSAAVQFAADCNTNLGALGTVYGLYDVSLIDAASCAVAYGTTANPVSITVANLPLATWISTTATTFLPPGGAGLHIHGIGVIAGAGGHTWIAYAYNAAPNIVVRAIAVHTTNMGTVDVADTQLWTDTTTLPWRLAILDSPTGVANANIIIGSNTNGTSTLMWSTFSTGAVVHTATGRYGLKLAAKPFALTGKNCALVSYAEGDPTFNSVSVARTYYVVELGIPTSLIPAADVRPLATIAPRIGVIPASSAQGEGLSLPSSLPLAIVSSNERAITPCLTIRSASGGVGVDVCDVKFTRALWQPAIVGGVTYLSGGVPCAFDGDRVTEVGFLFQPPSLGAVVSSPAGAGGPGPTAGTFVYTYAVVYEWRDKTGQRCQSRPTFTTASIPDSATHNNSVALTVPPLNLSLRQDQESGFAPVAIAIYRDTATAQGSLVRVFAGDIPNGLWNAYQTASLAFTDVASDASIAGNEGLYTVGNPGPLDAVCPSSLSCLIVHRNRLVGVGDDGTTLWFSTQYDSGSTQPYFNDNLTMQIPDGSVRALSSSDGHLIAYTADAIYVIDGDGPDVTGQNNTWTPPQRLAADLGCSSDWRSVVQFHAGTVFQSGSKLYLLERALEVSYFSGPIEDDLAANPVITSATLHAARNEIRFTCKATENATTGIVANYNYVSDTWSLFSYYDQDAAAFGAEVDSSLVRAGVWYHASRNGRVWTESASANGYDVDLAYLTSGLLANVHWIVETVTWAWAKVNGLQGFGRIWEAMVLEQSIAPHDATISLGYDYADAFVDVRTFTAAEIAAFTTPQPQMKVDCSRGKCEAIRVQFSDAPPTGVGQTVGSGANLLSLGLTMGVKPGRARLPAAQGK